MSQSRPLRNAILATRITAGTISAVSLALFILVLRYIFGWYDSQSTGLSVLPAVALGISIVWNLAAMITVNVMSRTSHAIIDLLVFCILVALGCIGFIHDDKDYLSNGHASDWYYNSSWLNQEIAAGGCMVASAVLQFLLVLLNLFSARKSKMLQKGEMFVVWPPPIYTNPKTAEPSKSKLQLEKEEWLADFDTQSLRSTSTSTDRKK